jgi:hypothetical protein
MLGPLAGCGRAKPEPDEPSSKGEDAPIGAEPRPAADDRITAANFRRRDVLQSWQMAVSAPLPIRRPAIFAPGDLMSEGDVRPVKVQQRTSGGCWRALEGLADFAIVQSYLSTAARASASSTRCASSS